MRAAGRAHHPTRQLVDDLMSRWFGSRRFEWLDVGVVGMVDYERLRARLEFRYTGADLSESVAEDSRDYLRRPDDRVVVWDIEDAPAAELRGRLDLVTLRHVVNHCEGYERPIAHAAELLRPGGRVVVVLHLALVDGPDQLLRHHDWDVAGEVIGNRYGRAGFFTAFTTLFEQPLWVRVDDGHKPNDLIVGRKRAEPLSGGQPLPPMHRLRMSTGRRNLPRRLLGRARLRLLARGR